MFYVNKGFYLNADYVYFLIFVPFLVHLILILNLLLMNFPKFLPVVIEIVIDGDGKQTFICRNSNGVVMQILHETSEISKFVADLCINLVAPVPISGDVNLTSSK